VFWSKFRPVWSQPRRRCSGNLGVGRTFFVGGRVILLVAGNELQEILHVILLHGRNEWGSDGLATCRGDPAGHTLLDDETTVNGKEVDVLGNTSLVKNPGQLSIGHEELGSQRDVPLVPSTGIFSEHLRRVRSDLLGPWGLRGGLVVVVACRLCSSPALLLGLAFLVLEPFDLLLALLLLSALFLGPSELLPHLGLGMSAAYGWTIYATRQLTSNMFKLALSLR